MKNNRLDWARRVYFNAWAVQISGAMIPTTFGASIDLSSLIPNTIEAQTSVRSCLHILLSHRYGKSRWS